MIITSNAKINIGLNITEKLPNGYHLLDMIMVPISLADKLEIKFNNQKGKLNISSNIKDIPCDEKNILYKVYKAFYEKAQIEPEDIDVYLEKNIPHEAGLGGGSSNGGFFLKELNKFHNFVLSDEDLSLVGKSVGADVPFFLKNTPCRVKGIGEKLEKIQNNLDCDVILVKPKFGVSTKKAYELYSKLDEKKFANIEEVLSGLKENNLKKVCENIENMLEQGLLIDDENIKNFRNRIKETGLDFFMSGSGSCYYILSSKNTTEDYLKILNQKFDDCRIIKCNFL
ncbi:4-(cytidine 5'-diphospho)-2-C-methyl-D-erythritol kinase [uncultured Fusobacterium sp.]|uniref:4-(cytidine 5'-diphospho)-2-C-methyl-D-erythritol kinase n=1 Tax=uncultured Fusobacterium sp. TaxID=159267 RepID=UPI0015A5BB5E|nr:4-(cytidine 5'-diphospho)-2-C-methyl-D-erythritol kinase [uncultured Fusobacterium sp.]